MKNQQVSIPLMVSSKDQWTGPEVKHFTIDNETDVLNLKDVSESLCQQ